MLSANIGRSYNFSAYLPEGLIERLSYRNDLRCAKFNIVLDALKAVRLGRGSQKRLDALRIDAKERKSSHSSQKFTLTSLFIRFTFLKGSTGH